MNLNITFNNKTLKKINTILLIIGNKMATIREIIEASRAQQDVILAAVTQTIALVREVKQLLALNDIPGVQTLLDSIDLNEEWAIYDFSAALVAAAMEQADVAAAVDAANGDPANRALFIFTGQ